MTEAPGTSSRPPTPESPMTNSLTTTNAHIEDLTLALANFSRVPSPELTQDSMTCCCLRDDCEHLKAWHSFKSKLESRLILSAEVGQALLQRHEAYVRRHEGRRELRRPEITEDASGQAESDAELQISELLKAKTSLERLLNQALVNNEVAEVSNKTVFNELQEARSTIARLTSQNVRFMGLENRLAGLAQQKDDIQQERDSELQRSRALEGRNTVLQERNAKLQAEVRRLQQDSERQRNHRMEISESIIQEARERLQDLQHSVGSTVEAEQTELADVVQSLMQDNEQLKQDNAELQALLSSTREDIRSLQQEVEEQRANPPSHTNTRMYHRHNLSYGSIPSSGLHRDNSRSPYKRQASLERTRRHPVEPLSPASIRVPISSTAPSTPSELTFNSNSRSYAVSQHSLENDFFSEDGVPGSPEKTKAHKSLLLLSRSRAVQTDPIEAPSISVAPSSHRSHISTPSPSDPRSESSSFSESQASHISSIVERASSLLTRLTAADALTLTNRLKRQHLAGADVSHLSRSTVKSIVSEATSLRNHYRALLEDEKVTTVCTRTDLRRLFKLLREFFVELGQLRIVMNDIVLDPSIAAKVSEQTLHPSKHDAQGKRTEEPALPLAGGFLAPISKLFGSPAPAGSSSSPSAKLLGATLNRAPSRPIPKLGPALAASTTTVNVEFSGTGIGRTNAVSVNADSTDARPPSRSNEPASYMGIFAGAPRTSTPDPWVILPRGPSRTQPSPLGPPRVPPNTSKFSRNVDAIVDVSSGEPSHHHDAEDENDVTPQHTLRRRGLSDSSIHSTFMAQKEDNYPALHPSMFDAPPSQGGPLPDRGSGVLRAFSRRMPGFRLASSASNVTTRPNEAGGERISSPPPSLGDFLPSAATLSSWVNPSTLHSNMSSRGETTIPGFKAMGHRDFY